MYISSPILRHHRLASCMLVETQRAGLDDVSCESLRCPPLGNLDPVQHLMVAYAQALKGSNYAHDHDYYRYTAVQPRNHPSVSHYDAHGKPKACFDPLLTDSAERTQQIDLCKAVERMFDRAKPAGLTNAQWTRLYETVRKHMDVFRFGFSSEPQPPPYHIAPNSAKKLSQSRSACNTTPTTSVVFSIA